MVNFAKLKSELEKDYIDFKSIRLLPKKYSQQLSDVCFKYIISVMGKKIKKVDIPPVDRKNMQIQIEDLREKEIDQALTALAKGLIYK